MKAILCTLTILVTSSVAAADDKQKSTPWKGIPQAIPGRIEAEHYDDGPSGVAYADKEQKNLGEPYRRNTEVDIEKRSDASNGHGIGWTRKDEWLHYTVNVAKHGEYTVTMPVASNKRGGLFHIERDGEDISGPISIPDTGGWDKLKTIQHTGLKLTRGVQTLRVVMDKQGPSGSIGDIDYFEFRCQ